MLFRLFDRLSYLPAVIGYLFYKEGQRQKHMKNANEEMLRQIQERDAINAQVETLRENERENETRGCDQWKI